MVGTALAVVPAAISAAPSLGFSGPLVDVMFFEDVGWNERQVVNGFTEFRRHASPPMDTKQIQVMATEIYGVRSDGHDFSDTDGWP